jgi:hypothetical protein
MGLALVAAAVLAGLALLVFPLLPGDDLVVRSLRWRSQLAVVLLIPEGVVLVLVVAWLRLLRALAPRRPAPPRRRLGTKSGRALNSQRHDPSEALRPLAPRRRSDELVRNRGAPRTKPSPLGAIWPVSRGGPGQVRRDVDRERA